MTHLREVLILPLTCYYLDPPLELTQFVVLNRCPADVEWIFPMTQPAPSHQITSYAPSVADEAVLRLLATYHYLTVQQICRALYSPGSLTRVQMIVKRITQAGYAQRLFLPRRTQAGSAPSIYTLSRTGRLFLKRLGVPVTVRVRPSEERSHSYLYLDHTLAVNDVLIAAAQLAKEESRVTLAAQRHERDLKHTPVVVRTATGERLGVIPDAWLDLRVGGEQYCVVLELDRGTEEKKVWKRKVRGLAAYACGPYQAAFATDSITIAVLTVAGHERLHNLVRWTEEELTATNNQDLGVGFLFAALVPAVVPPRRLFLDGVWQMPYTTLPHALIETDG